MPGGITYNSNSLQTSSIVTSEIEHHSSPAFKLTKAAIAHANRTSIMFGDYPDKTIRIDGMLVSTTGIAGMDALEDTFKSYLVGIEKNLDIEHNGSTRRYIATPTAISVERPGGLDWARFVVTFFCSLPFGTNTTTTSLTNQTSQTTGSASYPITVGGTFPYQAPIITVTYSAISGGTGKTVRIGNNDTGQQITITRDWIATDVLEVDVANSMVKVNGIEVEFSGAFPEFAPGSGTLTYSDDFTTSRTYSLVANHYRRFM